MTPENFVYWLNGFLEIGKPVVLNEIQVQEIKNHIRLVLNKQTVDLNYGLVSYLSPPHSC